jgi:hypothetical protein
MSPRWGLKRVFYGSVGFTHRYQYVTPNGAFKPFSTRNSHIII